MQRSKILLLASASACIAACSHPATAQTPSQASAGRATGRHPGEPPEAPAKWVGLLGEYDAPSGMRIVLEDGRQLYFADTVRHRAELTEASPNHFGISPSGARDILGASATAVRFDVDATGRAAKAWLGDVGMARRDIEPRPGTTQLQVKPVRPVGALRGEALAASPPHEDGTFRPADLVELAKLDPSIRLEIRYATTNNFLGTKFYDEARAFMQRPAAEAVVRANAALKSLGYGLLIHDAYRPWYVTKMFWDATPLDKRWLVADPSAGSKHNRGEAVDLTLYDLANGRPVAMPSTYDESTDRAYADYPGGTTAQRWRRAVLRKAMEAEGFTVNPTEWWHFDYKDWRQYAIGNVTFDKIAR
ncbi:MAG TPA: M15 family metallopeptidase [Gemmatimonadaceae bacterium]